jgi:hypothetical protein
MSAEDRIFEIRQAILKILEQCNGYLLMDRILRQHVERECLPIPTTRELDQEIKWLEENRFIAGVRPDLGGGVKWKITDEGKLARN